MLRKYNDLLFVALYTLVGFLSVIVKLPIPLLHVIFTLPLVLILPGYALVAAVFPRRLPRPIERLVMTLTLSLASTAVVGLLLNWSAPGLTDWAWLVVLPGITWGACLIAALRRYLVMPNTISFRMPMLWRYVVLIAVMACFGVSAIALARQGEASQPRASFSALSVVRQAGNTMEISVMNEEQAEMSYQLALVLNGVEIKHTDSFVVGKEATSKLLFHLSEGASGKLEIILSKAAEPEYAYRSAIIWLP
jgi:uncharacterized membrane protein